MDDNLIYNPNDYKQYFPFGRLNLLVQKFEKSLMNKPIKIPKANFCHQYNLQSNFSSLPDSYLCIFES